MIEHDKRFHRKLEQLRKGNAASPAVAKNCTVPVSDVSVDPKVQRVCKIIVIYFFHGDQFGRKSQPGHALHTEPQ